MLPWSVVAQDARQRTSETIIADALNQLPASNQKLFDQLMGEIASTGAAGVVQIAEMLVPASEGKNAIVEYLFHDSLPFSNYNFQIPLIGWSISLLAASSLMNCCATGSKCKVRFRRNAHNPMLTMLALR